MELKLDNEGQISQSLPCIACGYDLRGLRLEGTCPECGEAIRISAGKHLLRYADPTWVRQVELGVNLILGGILLALISFFLATCLLGVSGSTSGASDEVTIWIRVLALIPTVVSLLGYYWITRPEPEPASAAYVTPLRPWVWGLALFTSLMAVLDAAVPGWGAMHPVLMGLAMVYAVLSLAAVVVTCRFAMHHTLRLRSKPSCSLYRHTWIVMWGIVLTTGGLWLVWAATIVADELWGIDQGPSSDAFFVTDVWGRQIHTPWAGLQVPLALLYFVFAVWALVLIFRYRSRIKEEAAVLDVYGPDFMA